MRSILDLPRLGDDPASPFPATHEALDSPNGLLAWGGDLAPQRLLAACRAGIFPWYSEGQPGRWWSPAPRCVIVPAAVHLSRRTRRRYNSGAYRLSADSAFAEVVAGCAAPRTYDRGTWITDDLRTAFERLHALGHAHSVEVWQNDVLAGGIYGLAIGSIFFGESMFNRAVDASKIALVALCRLLDAWDYGLLDCQVGNPHLYRMGAVELGRNAFERRLQALTGEAREPGNWRGRVQSEPCFGVRW
ncbi:MAG: leucyl/phenylalanyl-tRNA--protein transferase [Xanthomonadales bacterium]|nr:leucyl/phenylalanyl-tRNA--protein transferase [Xanthomonadales bacterium]